MSSRNARIGKYQVLAELGRGGMSRVYLAAVAGPGGFNKLVVLKVLLSELAAEDPSFVDMFLDEAKLAARLNHPKIVQTNEVGNDGDRYFMAMEYLDGQSLHRILRRATRENGGLPTTMFLSIVADALEGLHAAHVAKSFDGTPLLIVHRDASPQNVFITYDGQVKVMDFGIAKAAGRGGEATRLGVLKGKVVYMAPEQVEAGRAVDHRADIFAMGVVLHDFLAKKRMWEGLSEVEIVSKLMKREIDHSPKRVNESVPATLDAICRRALAPEPDDRYPDARAMCDDIRAYLLNERTVPTDREIGALVAGLFAREREQISNIIEHQLETVNVDTDEPLPRLQSIGHETLTPASITAPPMPPPPRRRLALVAGLALAALVGVGLTVFFQRGTPSSTTTLAPPTVSIAPEEPKHSPPPTVVQPAVATAATTTASATEPETTAAKPRPIAQPVVPTFAPRPYIPPKPAPAATSAKPAVSEPASPPASPPRSTKPDLGY